MSKRYIQNTLRVVHSPVVEKLPVVDKTLPPYKFYLVKVLSSGQFPVLTEFALLPLFWPKNKRISAWATFFMELMLRMSILAIFDAKLVKRQLSWTVISFM